jgi:hypothetical protein
VKDHDDILKAIDEILEKPHQEERQRLTALYRVFDRYADGTSTQEVAQYLRDASCAQMACD